MTTKQTPEIAPEYDQARVVERPDGFYWQDRATDQLFGPFPSVHEAAQDMQNQNDVDIDNDFEVGETLEDAEAEIGISDWIDPETGEPAEESTTHLSDN